MGPFRIFATKVCVFINNAVFVRINSDTFDKLTGRPKRESAKQDYDGKEVCVNKKWEPSKFESTALFDTNLMEFTSDGRICRNSKVKIGVANQVYRLMANACSSSVDRLENHGYKMTDMVPLQEAVCAIYRNNGWDRENYLLRYL